MSVQKLDQENSTRPHQTHALIIQYRTSLPLSSQRHLLFNLALDSDCSRSPTRCRRFGLLVDALVSSASPNSFDPLPHLSHFSPSDANSKCNACADPSAPVYTTSSSRTPLSSQKSRLPPLWMLGGRLVYGLWHLVYHHVAQKGASTLPTVFGVWCVEVQRFSGGGLSLCCARIFGTCITSPQRMSSLLSPFRHTESFHSRNTLPLTPPNLGRYKTSLGPSILHLSKACRTSASGLLMFKFTAHCGKNLQLGGE